MAQARKAALLKGRLGAALALSAAAGVPTVVAFSETPRALPSGPWYGPHTGGDDAAAAAHASAAAWPVSRLVDQLLSTAVQVQTAEGSAPGTAAPAPAPTPADADHSAAGEAAGHMHRDQGPSGRPQLKFRRAGGASASDLAAQHQPELRHMRQLAVAELARLIAASNGSTACDQLPPRFTDAELMRFCCMHGLLRASTPAERQAALRDGAAAAARTALWLRDHTFASEEELLRFAHLISWKGTDAGGRPILVIQIGKAVSECRGSAAVEFANATITQVERCVQQLLPGDGSSASHGESGSATAAGSSSSASGAAEGRASSPSCEQIVVVMDCSGASTFNAARISWVFQSVAATLNKHYPGRLHELVLLELPVMLGWMVKGVKKLVHPETRHKFRVVPQGSQPPRPSGEACSAGGGSVDPTSTPAPLRLPLGHQQPPGVQQAASPAGAA